MWRVTYREPGIKDTDTFTTFEDAWAYSCIFPESMHDYKSWRYIAKKQVKEMFKTAYSITIAWIPGTDINITIRALKS
jgi:hypothetical protein